MAKNGVKGKTKAYKYNVLNIKLVSRKQVTQEVYRNLFEQAFSNKKIGLIRGETYGIIRQLFGKEEPFLYGLLCSFLKTGNQAMNIDNLEIVDFEIPKNLFLNPHEAEFVFYPELHRIAISHSKITLNSIKKMLEGIFSETIEDDESVEVTIEQSSDAFAKILNAKQIARVHIEISPSNGDINKDATEFIDNDLKTMGAAKFISDIRPNAMGKLNVTESTLLAGMFGVAQSNGTVVATIVNDLDKKEVVNTEAHPQRFESVAASVEDARMSLYDILKRRFRNGR